MGERIVDAAENNDYWTWVNVRAVLNSFGAYDIITFSDKVRYGSKSYFLTDRHLVRQRLILSPICWCAVFHTPDKPPLFGIR